ncbi:MAG: serine protease [Actinomycetia bacterium]|nr:serine protease [Actinomycetes bacterium]
MFSEPPSANAPEPEPTYDPQPTYDPEPSYDPDPEPTFDPAPTEAADASVSTYGPDPVPESRPEPDPSVVIGPSDPRSDRARLRRRRWMRVGRSAGAGLAVVAIGVGGFGIARATTPTTIINRTVQATAASNAAQKVSAATTDPAAYAAATVSPAVVEIAVGNGLGSGVLYDTQGDILTAAHVVSGSTTVEVTLSTGNTVRGTVVGADTASDVAVVRISPPSGIAPAVLATSTPQAGDLAVAIGSPYGLAETVTAGVVSSVDRTVQGVHLVQTDAAINPGNSGGPLVNAQGEVIGINTSIYSQSGGNEGLGFAIPIATAQRVANQLVATGV